MSVEPLYESLPAPAGTAACSLSSMDLNTYPRCVVSWLLNGNDLAWTRMNILMRWGAKLPSAQG